MQQAGATAIIPKYNYTPGSHSPNVEYEAFVFIPPSELVDGQFQ